MFTYLKQTFHYKIFTYSPTQSREQIITQMDDLFEKEKSSLKRPDITGRFIERPTSFWFKPNSSPYLNRELKSSPAFGKGRISHTADGQTTIQIAIRPNYVYLFFFVAFLIFGSIQLIYSLMETRSTVMFSGLFMILGAAPAMLGFAWATAKSLRSNFENYMGLQNHRKGGK